MCLAGWSRARGGGRRARSRVRPGGRDAVRRAGRRGPRPHCSIHEVVGTARVQGKVSGKPVAFETRSVPRVRGDLNVAAAIPLHTFLARAASLVGSEAPASLAAMRRHLGQRRIAIAVDRDRAHLRAGDGPFRSSRRAPLRDDHVVAATTRPSLRALVSGTSTLEEAVLSDAIGLRGALDDVLALHDAFLDFAAARRAAGLRELSTLFSTTRRSRKRTREREKKTKDAIRRDSRVLPDAPNCVTIFGAGVAGSTAAHELVERVSFRGAGLGAGSRRASPEARLRRRRAGARSGRAPTGRSSARERDARRQGRLQRTRDGPIMHLPATTTCSGASAQFKVVAPD